MGLSQKSLTGIQEFFLFRIPMNPSKGWKAKLERDYLFKIQFGKMTVCTSSSKFYYILGSGLVLHSINRWRFCGQEIYLRDGIADKFCSPENGFCL